MGILRLRALFEHSRCYYTPQRYALLQFRLPIPLFNLTLENTDAWYHRNPRYTTQNNRFSPLSTLNSAEDNSND